MWSAGRPSRRPGHVRADEFDLVRPRHPTLLRAGVPRVGMFLGAPTSDTDTPRSARRSPSDRDRSCAPCGSRVEPRPASTTASPGLFVTYSTSRASFPSLTGASTETRHCCVGPTAALPEYVLGVCETVIRSFEPFRRSVGRPCCSDRRIARRSGTRSAITLYDPSGDRGRSPSASPGSLPRETSRR